MNLGEETGVSIGGFPSRRDCDPKPGVARNELPREGAGISTNPNGVAPVRRNPVGIPGRGGARFMGRHGGTELKAVCLNSLCLSVSVVETGFMESTLFETDLPTGHEPGTPGGETPPSTAGGTPAATEARFMGSPRRGSPGKLVAWNFALLAVLSARLDWRRFGQTISCGGAKCPGFCCCRISRGTGPPVAIGAGRGVSMGGRFRRIASLRGGFDP
jgi:hypothetical protein